MRLTTQLIAVGVGAYLAFALALFPAATAYRWFAPEEIRLAGIQGTVWSGRAELGAGAGVALRDVRWAVRPAALAGGRAAARFQARLAGGFIQGEVRAGLADVRLLDLQASTRLATLRGVLPLADTTGLASLMLEKLELVDGWPVNAAGELRIAELEVTPLFLGEGDMIPLGGYRLSFRDTGGRGLLADINDSGGPLEVEGVLELGLDRAYRLEGFVRARPEASPDLVQGLEFMTADPDAAGRRPVSITGTH
jgi:general secretion pathway protein N